MNNAQCNTGLEAVHRLIFRRISVSEILGGGGVLLEFNGMSFEMFPSIEVLSLALW